MSQSQTQSISRADWICNNAERFLRFDMIRQLKLWEMLSATCFTVPLAWAGSGFINMFLKRYGENPDKYSVGQLIFVVFCAVIMVVIFSYYIGKLVRIVPLLLPYQGTGYQPSMKGEVSTAIGMGTGIYFFSNLKWLGAINGNLSERLWPFAFKADK